MPCAKWKTAAPMTRSCLQHANNDEKTASRRLTRTDHGHRAPSLVPPPGTTPVPLVCIIIHFRSRSQPQKRPDFASEGATSIRRIVNAAANSKTMWPISNAHVSNACLDAHRVPDFPTSRLPDLTSWLPGFLTSPLGSWHHMGAVGGDVDSGGGLFEILCHRVERIMAWLETWSVDRRMTWVMGGRIFGVQRHEPERDVPREDPDRQHREHEEEAADHENIFERRPRFCRCLLGRHRGPRIRRCALSMGRSRVRWQAKRATRGAQRPLARCVVLGNNRGRLGRLPVTQAHCAGLSGAPCGALAKRPTAMTWRTHDSICISPGSVEPGRAVRVWPSHHRLRHVCA